MVRKVPIFYSALLLTGVNLLLRFVSTSFQVFLSGKIGAAGIGLLQLVLSVGSLAMTVGMGGIRTATMYLSAEVIGQKRAGSMIWVLSACIVYSIVLSSVVGILLYQFAPNIAAGWIGDSTTTGAVQLLAGFLPVNCLCGVMIGHFTAINRIGALAAVEVAEQLLSMLITVLLLNFWAGTNASRACSSVIIGSGFGACLTLTTLLILKRLEKSPVDRRIHIGRKLWDTAVPLAIADTTKAGITTTENLMVPKRLGRFPGETMPLATFGMVCGMVFPVLMFPASILFGLAELLIPELARCSAAKSKIRIQHLAERSMLLALLYGAFCAGILFLLADFLCEKLYNDTQAGQHLRLYAILAPMLYCDIITDAMTKGLGQQKICVRNNIITSALDVLLLFILLPKYGMTGYFASFLLTHLINFLLSIRLLMRLVGKVMQFHTAAFTISAAISGVLIGSLLPNKAQALGFVLVYVAVLILSGVIKQRDFIWIKGLILQSKMNI